MRQALWIMLFTAIVVGASACTKQTSNMDESLQTQEDVLVTPQVTSEPSEETSATTTDVESLEQELGSLQLEAESFE
ncbi:hypothetical protein KBD71_04240 [Candidatus Woesebacteria bacterium]|nr:hypothetical protein [Candidatus Woesebacteria bacterium]